MKELEQKAKKDNAIMGLMKVNEIGHLIATTDKGPLTLRLRKGEKSKDYRFVLDAVPFEDKKNKELTSLYYGE